MKKNRLAQPFLKWAGGKRQLLSDLKKYIPKKYNTYYEPFVGAGALLFELQPKKAVINDINVELINCFQVIKNSINELLAELENYQDKNEENFYYEIRELDRTEEYQQMSSVQKAARIIYLNKTCYNGLFRVNSQGYFNVPFGRYKNPKILDEAVLKAINHYFNNNNVAILNTDFEEVLENAKKGDFIYIDPPYDPVSDTSSFTGYSLDGFGKEEQKRLKETFDLLTKKKCKVMLSNSATDFILDLYQDYQDTTVIVSANRSINSVSSRRGKIDEVLVMNYEQDQK